MYEAKCYSHELSVSVILKQPDERGMPSTDETSLLHEFEDAIRPHLQAELESVLAMVITCDGSRTFVFYTRDVENAIRRLQSIQPSFVHLQVDVSGRLDPRWTQFNRVAGTGG